MRNKKLFVCSILLLLLVASVLIVQINTAQSLTLNSTTLTKPVQSVGVAKDGTLFAASSGSIYKSVDKGQTWSTALTTVPNVDDISCLYVASNGYIYFSPSGSSLSQTNIGLWRSTNQGQTWTRVLTLGTSESVWGIDEDSQGNLYAGVYTIGDLNSNARIYKSSNSGASWSSVYYDSTARHVHCVRVDRSNNYIYATVGDNFGTWNTAYVLRSTNGGVTWTKILAGMPQAVAIEILPGARIFGTDYFSTNGLFRTTDDNSFSQVLDVGDSSYCFWIRKSDIENLVVAGFCGGEGSPRTAGIYASTDNGLSWTLTGSLPTQKAYDGTKTASNYIQGTIYHDVILNGVYQNGKSITSNAPTPTPTPTPTQPPAPQELFKADFETTSFSEYQAVNGAGTYTATVENSNPHHGSYNAKFTAGAASEGWAYKQLSSSPTAYYRQLLKVATLPASGTYLYLGSLQNSNSENTLDPFIYNSNGQYYWGTVSVINGVFYWDREASPSNPRTGVYYNVEICRDTAGQRSQLWVDGSSKVNVVRAHVGNTNMLCTGISYSESGSTVYVDCVRVSTAYIDPESSSPQPTPTPTVTPMPTPTPSPSDAPLINAIQVGANVTVTAVNFQQSTSQLNITITKNGTNQIEATIHKNSLPTIANLKIFINGSQKTYTYTDLVDSWKVTIKTT